MYVQTALTIAGGKCNGGAGTIRRVFVLPNAAAQNITGSFPPLGSAQRAAALSHGAARSRLCSSNVSNERHPRFATEKEEL